MFVRPAASLSWIVLLFRGVIRYDVRPYLETQDDV